jgi:tryptophan 2,3-dioxygenase
MDREHFYKTMNGKGKTDYEIYLNTKTLLSCQSDFNDLCNGDELQFQIVHQMQELLMKLIAYTLLDIDDYIQSEHTNRVISLFKRVHRLQEEMIRLFSLLEPRLRGNTRKYARSWAAGAGANPRDFTPW